MLNDFTTWLLQLIGGLFTAVWDFLLDLAIAVFSALCAVLVSLIGALPSFSVLANGLQATYGSLDPGILYALSALHLPACLALIGSAFVFRMGRKFVTLFQW